MILQFAAKLLQASINLQLLKLDSNEGYGYHVGTSWSCQRLIARDRLYVINHSLKINCWSISWKYSDRIGYRDIRAFASITHTCNFCSSFPWLNLKLSTLEMDAFDKKIFNPVISRWIVFWGKSCRLHVLTMYITNQATDDAPVYTQFDIFITIIIICRFLCKFARRTGWWEIKRAF